MTANKEHLVFVDDDIDVSPLIIGAVQTLKEAGYTVWEASSRGETNRKIAELQAQNIVAALAVIDGFAGRGRDIEEMLRNAFPGIRTLAFSYSNYHFGDAYLAKQAVEEDGMKWLIQSVQRLSQ